MKALAVLLISFGIAAPQFAYALTDSAQLTSSSQSFSITSTANLSPSSGTISIEGWIKIGTNPVSGGCVIVGGKWGTSNSTDSYTFGLQNNSGTDILLFATSNGSGHAQAQVNFTPSLNTWTYVAVSMTGTSVKFYSGVSGTPPTQVGTTQTNSDAPQAITQTFVTSSETGGNFGCTSGTTNFQTSLTRVWNSDQSSNFATNYCTVLGSGHTGLLAEWTLDSVVTDDSGNGNTLTNNGTVGFTADVPSCFGAVSSPGRAYFNVSWW